MKIVMRVALILVVAAAVIGVAVVLNQTGALQGMLGQAGQSAGHAMPAAGELAGAARPERPGGGEGGENLAGLAEVVKNLAIVVIFTLLVAIPSQFLQLRRRAVRGTAAV